MELIIAVYCSDHFLYIQKPKNAFITRGAQLHDGYPTCNKKEKKVFHSIYNDAIFFKF